MVDYSKWKDIEVSDDEDEVHPNIDTPSLFRWRHQARMERMAERTKEKEVLMKEKSEHEKKINELKEKMGKVNVNDDSEIKTSLEKLEKKGEEIRKKKNEFDKQEKLQPWNVDTISSEGFSKTLINNADKRVVEQLTEDEKMDQFKEFLKVNKSLVEEFGFFQRYDDSKNFLAKHPQLVSEHTASYLMIQCINLEMEEKHLLMAHVAHQSICINFIMELASQLDRDPRSCVAPFFNRIDKAEPEYKRVFKEELDGLISRVKARAEEKIEEAVQEVREERKGPGGLDPFEVMESLPQELKACFESQDLSKLQDTINDMDPKDAIYHMKRCVDSGLWVPQGCEDPNLGKNFEE